MGVDFLKAPACHLLFQASGHSYSPFSTCGRRGVGDEGQKKKDVRAPQTLLAKVSRLTSRAPDGAPLSYPTFTPCICNVPLL